MSKYKECKVELTDNLETDVKVLFEELIVKEKDKEKEYNRAKVHEETRKLVREYEGR